MMPSSKKMPPFAPEQIEIIRKIAKSRTRMTRKQQIELAERWGRTPGAIMSKVSELRIQMGCRVNLAGLPAPWKRPSRIDNSYRPTGRRVGRPPLQWPQAWIDAHHYGKSKAWSKSRIAEHIGVALTTYEYWLMRTRG